MIVSMDDIQNSALINKNRKSLIESIFRLTMQSIPSKSEDKIEEEGVER